MLRVKLCVVGEEAGLWRGLTHSAESGIADATGDSPLLSSECSGAALGPKLYLVSTRPVK